MNDPKEIADKVMTGFYRSCLGKNPTFQDDKIAVAAALRQVIEQFGYTHLYLDGDHGIGVVNIRDMMSVIDELENL